MNHVKKMAPIRSISRSIFYPSLVTLIQASLVVAPIVSARPAHANQQINGTAVYLKKSAECGNAKDSLCAALVDVVVTVNKAHDDTYDGSVELKDNSPNYWNTIHPTYTTFDKFKSSITAIVSEMSQPVKGRSDSIYEGALFGALLFGTLLLGAAPNSFNHKIGWVAVAGATVQGGAEGNSTFEKHQTEAQARITQLSTKFHNDAAKALSQYQGHTLIHIYAAAGMRPRDFYRADYFSKTLWEKLQQ